MADQPLPASIRSWIQDRNWGWHHLEWHATRQWDTLTPAQQQWALQQGWQRANHQEGEAGNGFDFLLMHRAMLQLLREQFPQQANLFTGWTTLPTDPDDPVDPVPAGNPRTFDANMLQAVQRLQNQPGSFADDDACGRFIETRRRPVPGDPFATSDDPTTGLHNYLHGRFSDSNSPINMGDPLLNLENSQFWRLHGWIDARWAAFRQAQGLSDTDAAYLQALNAEKHHLLGHMPPVMMGARAAVPVPVVPMALRRPFQDTLAKRFMRAMTTVPKIYTADELAEYLQIAISLEHYTLPPYLCALWSIKPAAANAPVRTILRDVALQEMLHMGLVCNLLKAIGRRPLINTPEAVPVYPNHLPGVNLADPIDLQPLSKARVELFLKIEMPQHGPLPDIVLTGAGAPPKAATIGDFYDIIDDGLARLDLTYQVAGQLETDIGNDQLFKIDSRDTARRAIKLIKEQGEGTSASQGAVDFGGGLAHYYQFRQLLLGKHYVQQPDGTWKVDPNSSLPFPPDTEIWPMDPVPAGGYPGVPEAQSFDKAYTDMLEQLQKAWDEGSDEALGNAVTLMYGLRGPAVALMGKKRLDGPGNYGPAFRLAASTSPPPAPGGMGGSALVAAVALPGYPRIKQILDQAVNGEDFGAHGAFWRGLTRDQFVAKSIFGKRLIAVRPDNTFDPDESNLVKALEGRAPFGANLTPPPAGAIYNRMPDGYPPMPAEQIAEIRAWIAGGCPEVPPNLVAWIDPAAGGPAPPAQHVEFWRDLDNWAMFNAVPPVPDDIDAFFGAAPLWLAFAKDSTQEAAWQQALAAPAVQQAVARLEARLRDTVVQHYGRPVPLLTLLDSFEHFGDETLPPDPQRPQDPLHSMNGAIMWFMWSAFTDACWRLAAGSAIPVEFWRGLARGILLGLINDGVFRGRFTVVGISQDAAGKAAALQYVRTLADTDLPGELARRYRESGL